MGEPPLRGRGAKAPRASARGGPRDGGGVATAMPRITAAALTGPLIGTEREAQVVHREGSRCGVAPAGTRTRIASMGGAGPTDERLEAREVRGPSIIGPPRGPAVRVFAGGLRPCGEGYSAKKGQGNRLEPDLSEARSVGVVVGNLEGVIYNGKGGARRARLARLAQTPFRRARLVASIKPSPTGRSKRYCGRNGARGGGFRRGGPACRLRGNRAPTRAYFMARQVRPGV